MLFVIHALDAQGSAAKREQFYPEHRAHQDNAAAFDVAIVIAGPLVSDDGTTTLGSLIIVEAKARADADAFSRADPFHRNGVWQTVQVHAYLKRRG
jgi:uncharacterized protein